MYQPDYFNEGVSQIEYNLSLFGILGYACKYIYKLDVIIFITVMWLINIVLCY